MTVRPPIRPVCVPLPSQPAKREPTHRSPVLVRHKRQRVSRHPLGAAAILGNMPGTVTSEDCMDCDLPEFASLYASARVPPSATLSSTCKRGDSMNDQSLDALDSLGCDADWAMSLGFDIDFPVDPELSTEMDALLADFDVDMNHVLDFDSPASPLDPSAGASSPVSTTARGVPATAPAPAPAPSIPPKVVSPPPSASDPALRTRCSKKKRTRRGSMFPTRAAIQPPGSVANNEVRRRMVTKVKRSGNYDSFMNQTLSAVITAGDASAPLQDLLIGSTHAPGGLVWLVTHSGCRNRPDENLSRGRGRDKLFQLASCMLKSLCAALMKLGHGVDIRSKLSDEDMATVFHGGFATALMRHTSTRERGQAIMDTVTRLAGAVRPGDDGVIVFPPALQTAFRSRATLEACKQMYCPGCSRFYGWRWKRCACTAP